MTEQEIWQAFQAVTPEAEGAGFTAWQFGGDPDGLARLVLWGIKTATTSALVFYEMEQEPLPSVGKYNLILDSRDQPVCITRTTRVYVTPFDQVTPDHARKEGEGDRSLDYWRGVHQDFFTGELETVGLTFCQELPVVCEAFKVVFPMP